MDENYNLKIRWDNAPHHRQIVTFPHHKHVEQEDNIQESEEPNCWGDFGMDKKGDFKMNNELMCFFAESSLLRPKRLCSPQN